MTELTNTDAERSIVAGILVQPDAIAEVAEWLPADAFADSKLRAVYKAIIRLWEKRIPATLVTVPPELIAMGGKSLDDATAFVLELITSATTSVYIAHDAETVLRFARLRAIADHGAALVAKAHAVEDFDLDDAFVEMRRSRDRYTRPVSTITAASDQLQHVRDYADLRLSGHKENVLPLRISRADRLLDGGLRDGQLMYLAARPAMGKSALMLHFAAYRRAAIFSLEMPWRDVRNRQVCALAGVPFGVGVANVVDAELRDRWLDATYQVETWPIHVYDHLRTTSSIEMECLRLQTEGNLDAVFIDHLGLLADDLRRGGEYERVSWISRRLKELALRINVPVVCLAQLNRGVESRPPYEPHMSDLRDSGRIEEDGDVVALLYRRYYYVAKGMIDASDADDRVIGTGWDRAKLAIEKNRNGDAGTVDLGWEGRYMRFHDASERTSA